MSMFKRILSLSMGFGLAMSTASVVHAQDQAIRAATTTTHPPFAFRNSSGDLDGFVVDLGRALVKELGRDLELVEQEWSGMFAGLYGGHYDLIVSPVSVTEERAKTMAFIEGYIETSLAFVTKSNVEMNDLSPLRGQSIAVNSGTVPDTWAQENAAKNGFEIQRYLNLPDAVQAVKAGRAFAALGDIGTVSYAIKQQPDLKLSQTTIQQDGIFAFAVRLEDTLLRNQLDSALECLKQKGTVAEIYQRWLGFPPPEDSPAVNIVAGYGPAGFENYEPTEHEVKCK